MTDEYVRSAVEHFAALPDPRIDRTKKHKLLDIVVIALCAVIANAESFVDIEDFGRAKEEWLREFLELPNGIPSHDTFTRVFARLDPTQWQVCFLDWVRSVAGGKLAGDTVALDGKSLRGSATTDERASHMLNAWSTRHGLCLAQEAVDGKSNEISTLPAVIDTLSLLELSGCTVTVDAMGAQREVARKLQAQEADYLLALKGNQTYLHDDVREMFEDAKKRSFEVAHDFFETSERGHGRVETRRCWTLPATPDLDDHAWPGLKSVVLVEGERTVGNQTSVEKRYFLTSLAGDARQALEAVRAHWGIENKLHWVLDVVFGEDGHSYARDHGPENMAVMRQLALNLVKRDTSKGSLKGKRKRAGWDEDYLAYLLGQLNPDLDA